MQLLLYAWFSSLKHFIHLFTAVLKLDATVFTGLS